MMLFEHLSKPLALVLVKFWWAPATRIWSKTVDSVVIPAIDPAARGRRRNADTRRCFRERITEIDIFDQTQSPDEIGFIVRLSLVDRLVEFLFTQVFELILRRSRLSPYSWPNLTYFPAITTRRPSGTHLWWIVHLRDQAYGRSTRAVFAPLRQSLSGGSSAVSIERKTAQDTDHYTGEPLFEHTERANVSLHFRASRSTLPSASRLTRGRADPIPRNSPPASPRRIGRSHRSPR